LIGRRGTGESGKPIYGSGQFQIPGGHLELGESFEACSVREIKEETDIDVEEASIQYLMATNNVMSTDNMHYVTIFMAVQVDKDVEASLMEPTKCDGWNWYTLAELMQLVPLFTPLKQFLQNTRACQKLMTFARDGLLL
jgi:8-oxo-dGTP diphosphatase